MSAKAIETHYEGYRFRSRLEARWAVFFTSLGLDWEYEKEGFNLGQAGCYLPDFWIPFWGTWVEIKPDEPAEQERFDSFRASGRKLLIIKGIPKPGGYDIDYDGSDNAWFGQCRYCDAVILVDNLIQEVGFLEGCYPECYVPKWNIGPGQGNHPEPRVAENGRLVRCPCKFGKSPSRDIYLPTHSRVVQSLNSALAARFEHGEKG